MWTNNGLPAIISTVVHSPCLAILSDAGVFFSIPLTAALLLIILAPGVAALTAVPKILQQGLEITNTILVIKYRHVRY